MDETLNEKTVSAEFTQRVLLDQRNPGMAAKIESLLKHDKITFVGVGLPALDREKECAGVVAAARVCGRALCIKRVLAPCSALPLAGARSTVHGV